MQIYKYPMSLTHGSLHISSHHDPANMQSVKSKTAKHSDRVPTRNANITAILSLIRFFKKMLNLLLGVQNYPAVQIKIITQS